MLEKENEATKFAMKLIGKRRRSVFEIKQKLKEKGYSVETIKKTIDELKQHKYLDDMEFTKSYIRDKIRLRPCGKRLLKLELKKKGVDEKIIDERLEEMLSEKEESEMAKKILEKKRRSIFSKDPEKIYSKIIFHLRSKGFSEKIIQDALKESKINQRIIP